MAKTKYSILEILVLAMVFEKSTQTINRWVSQGNDILTSDKAKRALKSLPQKKQLCK